MVATGSLVVGSIRWTVRSPLFATQIAPKPETIPLGLAPTRIVWTGRAVALSTRVTVPSVVFATHSDPSATATPSGSPPTVATAMTWPVASIRPTLLAPTAIDAGVGDAPSDGTAEEDEPSGEPVAVVPGEAPVAPALGRTVAVGDGLAGGDLWLMTLAVTTTSATATIPTRIARPRPKVATGTAYRIPALRIR